MIQSFLDRSDLHLRPETVFQKNRIKSSIALSNVHIKSGSILNKILLHVKQNQTFVVRHLAYFFNFFLETWLCPRPPLSNLFAGVRLLRGAPHAGLLQDQPGHGRGALEDVEARRARRNRGQCCTIQRRMINSEERFWPLLILRNEM